MSERKDNILSFQRSLVNDSASGERAKSSG